MSQKSILPTSELPPGDKNRNKDSTMASSRSSWRYPFLLLAVGLFVFTKVHGVELPRSIDGRVDNILSETPLIGRYWTHLQ